MNGVQYNKLIQLTSSYKSQRRTKRKTERSVEDANTSEKFIPSVLPMMDISIGQAHSSDDNDDFFALLQDGKSYPPMENPRLLKAHQSLIIFKRSHNLMGHNEMTSQIHQCVLHVDDWSQICRKQHIIINYSFYQAFEELRVQVFELQADNKVLKAELDNIKSQMSSLNEGKTNKMDDIIQMQAFIESDLMDIWTNMQFLSEFVTSERGVRQTEALGVGDQEYHVAGGFDKAQEVEKVVSNVHRKGKGKIDPSDDLLFSLEPPSFDLRTEYTPPDVLHSKEIQKRVDSIIFDVVMTTKTVLK
ncbi:Hypothetical predicted protein [Olea europaea subsp. europaea]|uniref:Uncharacterized protein n=1 Tax=Olea europaea subsp. europaea TaxID=158383 RepID=A0A8S0QCJ9_OLEEU|nr:Hypothetical predicted protein [Olea europaea subsp. europaea]